VARIASHESWANTADRAGRTAPARKAFSDRFERQVDPDGTMDPTDRARRAEHAKSAYFARLSLKSAQARRARRHADALDAEVETALSDVDGAVA
jgi:hypothetical protein